MDYLKEISQILSQITELEESLIISLLETPPNQDMGDLAFPCFQLAKKFKKAPNKIAEDLKAKITFPSNSFFESMKVLGPYLNFYFNYSKVSETVFNKISLQKEKYGFKSSNNKIVLVESPSPNTNKPLHLGHLRNMALGESVSNIIKTQGYNVKMVNLYNDRGIHICKSILAYKLWGNNKLPDKKSDHFVGDYYVLFERKSKEDESLNDQVKEILKQWEKNDPEIIELWEKMNNWAFAGMEETYKLFRFSIDNNYYESKVYKKGKEIILKGLQDGIFYKDDTGAVGVDLGKKLGEKFLLRSDGTSMYITQDIYLAKAKYDQFSYAKSIYVVGNEQDYHFQVLFEILKKLKFDFADGCHHLSYGMVNLPDGKMKSREGTVVDADDLIGEIRKLAQDELRKREINNPDTALKIALAALKYYLLKIAPNKDFTYNPEESISFEGDTGPYLQYTYVRASKIVKKLNLNINEITPNYNLLSHPSEKILIKQLLEYPSILEKSAEDYTPNTLTQFILKLCQNFNSFYEQCRVVGAEPVDLEYMRGILLTNFVIILNSCLNLIGIETIEEM